ncbi:hypothetical protein BDF20DRAFT_595434 [Mycotypha africana]|uniref:uncharacterized protein n=1 Tax=Mycotypha africana TaxID=64632 RepID=UPI0023012AB6|nr:uncharacterized protein BDF20DRAFT_595434 [Mycotypha africana]KAI8975251.1 hypothetical protein BDF20DRAFT_595434 [Mycotypha africana]
MNSKLQMLYKYTLFSNKRTNDSVTKNFKPRSSGIIHILQPRRLQLQQQCRSFHSSPIISRSYYFDTFKFVERLEKQGFTRKQSEAIMIALQIVIAENMMDISKIMVSKADRDKAIYAYKVDFTQLKSEIQLLERKNNDFHLMKIETERLESELEKLKQKLREEISRNQAHARLEMSLERGHVRDEVSIQKLKIEETDTRIESEVAGLRTQMEATKFQILQYLMGSLTGAGALFLAYLRMFK